MELDEIEVLREQVRLQAETIANLHFELSKQKAIIAVLLKNKEEKKEY